MLKIEISKQIVLIKTSVIILSACFVIMFKIAIYQEAESLFERGCIFVADCVNPTQVESKGFISGNVNFLIDVFQRLSLKHMARTIVQNIP